MTFNCPIGETKFPTKPISIGCDFISGYAFKGKDFVDNGNPVIKIKNIQNGKVTIEGSQFVSDGIITDKLSKFKLNNGDILIAMTGQGSVGRVGKLYISEGVAPYLNQRVGKFVADEKNINKNFLYYIISTKAYENYLFSAGSGSGQPNLSPGIIRAIEIPFPPYNVQCHIGNILKELDDKIELNRQMNQTLEEIAQAVFQSWFVDFGPTRAKIAAKESDQDPTRAAMATLSGKTIEQLDTLPHEQLATLTTTAALFPDTLVDSDLGEIPAGWEVSTLGTHFDVIMGQSPKGDTYNEDSNGMLFFQGRRDFGFRYPTPRVYTTDPKRIAKAGDTLISVRAPVGDRNMAAVECCLGRGVASIRHKTGARSFTYAFIGHIERSLGDSGSDGTVFSSINKKELGAVSFIAPDEDLVDLFEENLTPIDQQVEVNSHEIDSLEKLRDTLLPKLLSGELEISSAN